MARPYAKSNHPVIHAGNPKFFVWASLAVVTLVTIAVVALVYGARSVKEAQAYPVTPDAAGWVIDGSGGFQERVQSIVSDDERTYISGRFSYVGPYTGSSVRLDAATGVRQDAADINTGHAVGTARVSAVEPDGDGGWYVGGILNSQYNSTANGVSISNLVHLNADGSLDSNFNAGFPLNSTVDIYDLVFDGSQNTLYVAGNFTTIQSTTRNRIAALAADTGTLISGWDAGANNVVYDMALNGDRLYYTGAFTAIGPGTPSTTRTRVAAVGKVGSGTLGAGVADVWAPGICQEGYAIAVKPDGSAVYVGGQLSSAISAGETCGGTARGGIAAFDGANSSNAGTLDADWNPNSNGNVNDIVINAAGTSLYAGGNFTVMAGVNHRYIAAIDPDLANSAPVSSTWTASIGAGAQATSLALHGTDLIVAGDFLTVNGTEIRRLDLAKFDADRTGTGTLQSWDPKSNYSVSTIKVDGDDLFMGGFFNSTTGYYRSKIAAFDNDTMELDLGFDPGTVLPVDGLDVATLAVGDTHLYAGGNFGTVGNTGTLLARFNKVTGVIDSSWDPRPNNVVGTLMLDGNNLYVGGLFSAFDPPAPSSAPSESVDSLAKLDITRNTATTNPVDANWKPGVTGSAERIDTILKHPTDTDVLFVAGDFTTVGTGADNADPDVQKLSKSDGAAAVAGFLSTFNPASNNGGARSLQISADGSQLYLTAYTDIARLSTATGTVDAGWFTGETDTNGYIAALQLDEPNGKFYIGGLFSSVAGLNRQNAAEIALDGTVSSWNPGFDSYVLDYDVRDNRLVAGGFFTVTGPQSTSPRVFRQHLAVFSSNTIGFSSAASSGAESITPANLQVTLATTNAADTTVQYAVTGGSASGSGVDYTLASGTATVIAGTLTTNIPITIVNDDLHELGETIVVTLSSPSSNAVLGSNTAHTYTITDNDPVGVSIVQSGGTTTVTEGGATDSYTVVLTSEPTANVNVALSSAGQATGAPTPLTFTSGNWDTPQTVTVTAFNDDSVEGPHGDTIEHTVTSSDTDYNNFAAADVVVSITDNDVASVQITESGGATQVTEGGAGDSYDVVLTSEPTNNVVVTLTVDSQLDAGPSPLTFTSGNWDTPQTVTVSADDDASAEGLHVASITHSSASSDTNYNGILVDQVDVTITDNDTASVIITESSGGTTVTEGGATDSYTVVLSSQPTDSVTITLTPSGQVTVGPNPLTFTTGNWDDAQTVTVTAINDEIAEGTHPGLVEHAAESNDADYDGVAIVDVSVSITDNDTAGATIVQSGGTTQVAEGGTTDSFTVVLTSEPTADVTVTLSDGPDSDAAPSPLTFTSGNWDTPQSVTVSAVDDAIYEGTHSDAESFDFSSADGFYNVVTTADVSVTVLDNDTASVVVTESGGSTNVTEGGATDTFTVVLTSQPTADVQISLNIVNQVLASPSSLLFTNADWNVPQSVIVTAIDDASVEGTHQTTIVNSAVSSDPIYDGIDVDDVVVTITDDDSSPTPSEPSGEQPAVNLLDGSTAAEQAIAVSKARFVEPGSANGVILATQERDGVDAFTSTALSAQKNYTLMLSDGVSVSQDTIQEMKRALGNDAKPVILVGGVVALSEQVELDVKAAAFSNVFRFAGADRRRTAEIIAQTVAQHNLLGLAESIFVSDDTKLIDGLSAGAATTVQGSGETMPILISRRGSPILDQTVADFIRDHNVKTAYVVGGSAALPDNIDEQIKALTGSTAVVRLAGSDRYETNKVILDQFFPAPDTVVAVRGDEVSIMQLPPAEVEATSVVAASPLVTALMANALGGQIQAPVVLVTVSTIPEPTRAYVTAHASTLERLYIVADFDILAQSVVDGLAAIF